MGSLSFLLLLFFSLYYVSFAQESRDDITAAVVNPAAPISMSSCSSCHRNLDAFKNPKLIFNHPVHLEKGIRCQSCHQEFPHQPGKIIKPDMQVCFQCHGLKHGAQGTMAPDDCTTCHPKGFRLDISPHGDQWIPTHKIQASSNLNYCLNCHKVERCNTCHTARKVKPLYHTIEWKVTHGKREADQLAACNACHDKKFCTGCHQTSVPHQADWVDEHPNYARQSKSDCKICHKTLTLCDQCHHKEKTPDLLEKCTKCHKSPPPEINSFLTRHQNLPSGYNCNTCHVSTTSVTMSLCSPCHSNLDAFKNPKLIFNHPVHLEKGIRCQSCHQEFPHQPGKIIKPDMQVCFQCHGLKHGVKGTVAPSECSTCHPKSLNLSRSSHEGDWILLHKEKAGENDNYCIRCHQSKECETCHQARKAVALKLTEIALPGPETMLPKPEVVGVRKIEISLPATMSKCSPCHNNLDAFKNPSLVFNHPVHLEKGIRCLACHQEYPHQSGKTVVKPGMAICFTCHGFYHAGEIIAPRDCLTCHPKNFVLKPTSHTSQWRPKLHSVEAKKDRDKCLTCHELKFCQKCHGLEEMPHPENWKPKLHKIKAIEKEEVCYQCHGNDYLFCDKCHHKNYGPPPGYWWSKTPGLSNHPKIVKEQGAATCIECHGPTYCAKCHITGEKATGGKAGPSSL